MGKGILYRDCDSLVVMESLKDNNYDLVYLDVPHFTGSNDFSYSGEYKSIRHYLADKRNCPIGDITRDDVADERKRQNEMQEKEYAKNITHIIENAYRLLSDEGILCFLSPSKEYIDINFRLILDQFFNSSMNVTLERRVRNVTLTNGQHGNNDVLYFYSKKPNFVFPVLTELRDIGEFSDKDDFDYYKKMPLTQPSNRPEFQFEWNGINLGRMSWRYHREKLDELFEQGRIIISNGKAYLKAYRSEHPVTVSSVWKNEDEFNSEISIGSQSYERIFTISVPNGGKVLCPYDRNGKFSLIANNRGLDWTSVYCPLIEDSRMNFISQIPKNCYEEGIMVVSTKVVTYKNDVVTNVGDIENLKGKVNSMIEDIHKIQDSLGMEETDEVKIDEIIDKIHEMTQKFVANFDLRKCIPVAEEWIEPCWAKLEVDSKKFLPTGVLFSNIGIMLANQENAGMEMTPTVIEYCKTLENELFEKIYHGYVNDLRDRHINVRRKFNDSFQNSQMKEFLKFLQSATFYDKENPEKWHLEIGKMIKILKFTLVDDLQEDVIQDFKKYLENTFAASFFDIEFMQDLDMINILRNDCAHSSFVDMNRAEIGKKVIREKLMNILKNYK